MRDQIIEFVVQHPAVVIPLVLLLLPFALVRRYRRIKRKTSHINDAKSKSMLVLGFAVAIVIIVGWLLLS